MFAEFDAIENYQDFMTEGDKYLKTAKGGIKRPAIFTSEILYNIIGLAIEKHVMGALMAKGHMVGFGPKDEVLPKVVARKPAPKRPQLAVVPDVGTKT